MTVDDPLDDRLVDAGGFCRSCGFAVGELPPVARYCPDCGVLVRPTLSGWARTRLRLSRLRWSRRLPDAVPVGPPTRILVGYGNALFSLGWRYERGGGGSRNLPEAIRCYRKSARLGNADAALRLNSSNPVAPVSVLPVEPGN